LRRNGYRSSSPLSPPYTQLTCSLYSSTHGQGEFLVQVSLVPAKVAVLSLHPFEVEDPPTSPQHRLLTSPSTTSSCSVSLTRARSARYASHSSFLFTSRSLEPSRPLAGHASPQERHRSHLRSQFNPQSAHRLPLRSYPHPRRTNRPRSSPVSVHRSAQVLLSESRQALPRPELCERRRALPSLAEGGEVFGGSMQVLCG
jgi:hypothetical protein